MTDYLTARRLGLKFVWLLLLGIFLTVPLLCSAKDPVLFDGLSEVDTTASNTSTLDDPTGRYSFEQAVALLAASDGAPSSERDCASVCWIKVTLRNTLDRDVIAELDVIGNNQYFDTWVVRGQSGSAAAHAGRRRCDDQPP